MRDLKNKSKLMKTSLVALTLATTVVSQTNVNVYAEEVVNDSQEETEIVNTENTDSLEESTEEESTDIQEESNTETMETNEVSEEKTTPDLEYTSTNEEIAPLSDTKNAGSFNVTGGTSGTEWEYDSSANTLTFNTSGTYTITGDGQQTSEKIVVADYFNGTISIENINIKADCAFEVKSTATLTLKLSGNNILTSTLSAGLHFANAEEGLLTITSDSDGSLTTKGGREAAGIGGDFNENGNKITINGGTINVTETLGGAGIGGGSSGEGSNITINDGTIIATSLYGAGIGGGEMGNASNIIIDGGIVNASSRTGAGIGGGYNGEGNSIKINGGTVTATGGRDGAGIGGGNEKPGKNIKITGGIVTANGGSDAAGIGGGFGGEGNNITIEGGSVKAIGGNSAAGIGGGYEGTGRNITVIDGTVDAIGGNSAAGIGGGYKGYGEDINIYDATVTATGGNNGAGIGGGDYGYGTGITIYGGTVIATGGECGAGIGGGHNENGMFINIFGGTVTATATSGGAGIGGGSGKSGGYMNIYGGTVTATATSGGAGIGGGLSGAAISVSILGGTVTATATDNGAGIGGGAGSSSNAITIEGGSVKASSIDDPIRNIQALYLAKLENQSGVNVVTVDDDVFTRLGDHPDDGAFYLYLTGEDHTLTTSLGKYKAIWNGVNGFYIYMYAPTPTITIDKTTANSITIQPLENQDIYGTAEYKINEGQWQESNEFTGLEVDTEYTVYARYKGNDTYIQSTEEKAVVKTPKDGNALVKASKPTNLTGVYEQKLLNVTLPDGWTWVYGNTDLSVETQSYLAHFDTTAYESEYDFTGVEGYNSKQNYVAMNLTIDVLKADSSITITTSSLDKAYDGNAVEIPKYTISGSSGQVTIKWQKNTGTDSSPVWEDLTDAPSTAGSYQVVVELAGDNNYNSASETKTFTISKSENIWIEGPSITGWTYGDEAKKPIATSKYGTVAFTYSDSIDGTYTESVPTNPGTYYVKATVAGNENYTGLEDIVEFTIKKAESSISFKEGFTLNKTYDGNVVVIDKKDLETKGSTGNIVFTYEEKIDDTWTVLENAPTKAGTYRVTATLNEDANHNSSTSKALEFVIEKADTVLEFSTDNMNKTYDAKAVSEPTIKKTGNSNEVVFTWYKKDGNDWKELSSAPVGAGNYKVVASVEADDNYNAASVEMEFTISQATNAWTSELSIKGWTFGEQSNAPTATSKYGTVTFTYSDSKDGTYTDTVPTDAGTYYVKATVTGNENYTGLESIQSFEIKKANSSIVITISSLDKEYDGNTVNSPDVEKSGSTKDVTFTWYQEDGKDWKELSSAPVHAGNYKVIASVEADNNYNGATAELEFTISQTANGWAEELSIEGWTYGEQPNSPIATSKYGEVVFTYSDSKDGTYTDTVPTNAETYYVKATVDGSENYTGLEEIMSFEISKAVPEYSIPTDLTIEQGNPLSTVKLPKGFTWKDETQKADKLGKQTFKAIYTPEDTNNYQTVETEITVNVVANTSSKDENNDSKTEGTNTSTQTNQMMWVSITTLSALLISALSVLKLRKHK